MKSVIIGLDGFEPALVQRWLNHLPTFAMLRNRGLSGRAKSCVPPVAIPGWPAMMSSHDPGSLGIYGQGNRAASTYGSLVPARSDSIRVERLWDILGGLGKTSAVLDVPGTFPPGPLLGQMVSSGTVLARKGNSCWPASLAEEISGWPVCEQSGAVGGLSRHCDKAVLFREIRDAAQQRFVIAREIFKKYQPDFSILVEPGAAQMHRQFWRYMDPAHRKFTPNHPLAAAIHDYYVSIDGQLEGLLQEIDLEETNVLVISDRGAKRLDGGICVNDWLMREGYLVLKSPAEPGTPWNQCDVDWTRTLAWCEGGSYARISLNLVGREPEGVVAPGEYERLRAELSHRLARIPDDRGRPMKTFTLKPQQIYSRVNGIPPDLIVIFDDWHWCAVDSVGHEKLRVLDDDSVPDDVNPSQYGLFSWLVPGEPAADESTEIDVLDVAPTILSLMGLPVPLGMQGRTLPIAKTGSACAKPEPAEAG